MKVDKSWDWKINESYNSMKYVLENEFEKEKKQNLENGDQTKT